MSHTPLRRRTPPAQHWVQSGPANHGSPSPPSLWCCSPGGHLRILHHLLPFPRSPPSSLHTSQPPGQPPYCFFRLRTLAPAGSSLHLDCSSLGYLQGSGPHFFKTLLKRHLPGRPARIPLLTITTSPSPSPPYPHPTHPNSSSCLLSFAFCFSHKI